MIILIARIVFSASIDSNAMFHLTSSSRFLELQYKSFKNPSGNLRPRSPSPDFLRRHLSLYAKNPPIMQIPNIAAHCFGNPLSPPARPPSTAHLVAFPPPRVTVNSALASPSPSSCVYCGPAFPSASCARRSSPGRGPHAPDLPGRGFRARCGRVRVALRG
jgi:hypothetical protein